MAGRVDVGIAREAVGEVEDVERIDAEGHLPETREADILGQAQIDVIEIGEPGRSGLFDVEVHIAAEGDGRPLRRRRVDQLDIGEPLPGVGESGDVDPPRQLVKEAQLGHPVGIGSAPGPLPVLDLDVRRVDIAALAVMDLIDLISE